MYHAIQLLFTETFLLVMTLFIVCTPNILVRMSGDSCMTYICSLFLPIRWLPCTWQLNMVTSP